jgi:hypothetical protein
LYSTLRRFTRFVHLLRLKSGSMSPLDRLLRKDKWFLGGGKGAIYAPTFPRWLLNPGFWDECYFADIRLDRLFCILALDDRDRPVQWHSELQDWRPDRLMLHHQSQDRRLRERRCVLEEQVWISELTLEHGPPLNLFLWSLPAVRELGVAQPWQSVTACQPRPQHIALTLETAWPAELLPDRTAVSQQAEAPGASVSMLPALAVHLALGADGERGSWAVQLAQHHEDLPRYELSVLPDIWRHDRLPNEMRFQVGVPPTSGLLHVLQHYRIEPGQTIQFGCAAGLSGDQAAESLSVALADRAVDRSERAWRLYFSELPQFESSDPFLTNAYWHRWYGLRLNTVDIPDLPIAQSDNRFSPFVTEGVGFFRNFITYSAQAHLREVSWMHRPWLALGILRNLAKVQRGDGSLPGHSYSNRPSRDFYHADFATGSLQLEQLHRVRDEASLGALEAYADYFLTHRRADASVLQFLVLDQNETGQEYMSRYQFVSSEADQWKPFRVAGVDAAAYIALLLRYLADRSLSGERYGALFDQALAGLRAMQQDGFYCDLTEQGALSPARPATGFYGILAEDDPALLQAFDWSRWLSEAEFWLPSGIPATAATDPSFCPDPFWKDKRMNCPWNGRSWPMTNCHVVDAIAHAARTTDDPDLKGRAADALQKTIRLMFHHGDPARPNSYEHYNPIIGAACLYRGYDDYMHSWIVDLIMRHAVGVQPGQARLDPLPLDVDWIKCTAIPHPDGWLDASISGGRAEVRLEPRPSF